MGTSGGRNLQYECVCRPLCSFPLPIAPRRSPPVLNGHAGLAKSLSIELPQLVPLSLAFAHQSCESSICGEVPVRRVGDGLEELNRSGNVWPWVGNGELGGVQPRGGM